MSKHHSTIAALALSVGVFTLTGCIVQPPQNSTNQVNNSSYQPHDQVQAGNQRQDAGREYDRGCADAKVGSYDRSGNASQAYENGWSACRSQNTDAPNNAPAASNTGQAVAPGNMAAYCRGEASAQYGVKPTYITTERLLRTNDGGYSISGTADAGNQGMKQFKCSYDQNQRFQGVQSLAPNNAPAVSNTGQAVAPGNMAAYCRGEASAQYGVKPTYITTERLLRTNDGGYSINGTADTGNQGMKPFKCTYDQNQRFQGVQSLVNEGYL